MECEQIERHTYKSDCFLWEHCTNAENDDIDLNILRVRDRHFVRTESHTEGLYHEILGRSIPLLEGSSMHFKEHRLLLYHYIHDLLLHLGVIFLLLCSSGTSVELSPIDAR